MNSVLRLVLVTAGSAWLAHRAELGARRAAALDRLRPPARVAGHARRRLRLLGARAAERRRHAAVARDLPLAVELLRVAVSAGATPVQAVELVAADGPPAVAAPLRAVVRALDLGDGFEESLAVLRGRAGLSRVADALDETASLGVGVEDMLGRLAAELRDDVRRAAQERARTVPVRLLFPLVFLVLPAFGLLGIAPSLIAGFGR